MNKFQHLIVCLLLMLFASSSAALSQTWAVIDKIVDGDTVWIATEQNHKLKRQRVRLIGVDTLEVDGGVKAKKDADRLHTSESKMKTGGYDAKKFLLSKIPKGSKVKIVDDLRPYDQYGRRLSYVYTENGEFINKSLIEQGYAGLLIYAPNDAKANELNQSLQTAKKNKAGLWGKGFILTERWKR